MKMTVYMRDDAFNRKDLKEFVKDAVRDQVNSSLFAKKILPDDIKFELSVDVKLTRK